MQSLNTSSLSLLFRLLLSKKNRIHLLTPNLTLPDMTRLDFARLKKAGFKAVVFDKDNTLTAPYATHIHPPFMEKWRECRRVFGDKVCIVSNSAGGPDDYPTYTQAIQIEQEMDVHVLRHPRDKKPEGGDGVCKYFGLKGCEIVVVGDRLLTDVVYANSMGAYSVWCTRIVTAKGDNWVAAQIRKLEHLYWGIKN